MSNWMKELPIAITVCDKDGVALEMNDKSAKTFEADGGRDLVGKNLLDCHPEPSRTKLVELLESKTANIYTIEKNGDKKMIYQTPWYEKGEYKGLVELSLDIPKDMPHFIRS
jgi:transcriptional regulator with PAS, ATPase and Fis domain